MDARAHAVSDQAPRVLIALDLDHFKIDWSHGVTEWLPGENFGTAALRADMALYADKAERERN